jgi:osmotically-inducible protein OsmY
VTVKKLFLVAMFSLTVVTCYAASNYPTQTNTTNSGSYVSDRNGTQADTTITQNIRNAIMADNTLSTTAKNVSVSTSNGVVTLSGSVTTTQEKDAIAKKAKAVQGVDKVDNQIEVIRSNY